jgi:hypothetical protein
MVSFVIITSCILMFCLIITKKNSYYLQIISRNYIFFTIYFVVSKNHCIFATD